jgi:murein DD-endopeptidase MepM/ murein hydrolase activator NlpD
VNAGEIGITLRHDDGWQSYFTGFYQSVSVSKGQSVSQGHVLGKIDRFNGSGMAGFHWGVARDNSSEQVSCPADFVSADARSAMQQLLDQSTFPEKARFPLLCNACPAGGCR